MRVAIDTNMYTDAARAVPQAVEVLRSANEIWIPFVVLGELRAGFACGTYGRKNEATLIRFLNSPRVKPVWADEATAHVYARVFAELRSRGTPIPTNDLWIAALAIQHDLVLFSRDEHFSLVPQIARL